jgi:single-stranded-DNA-specific exonuclease
MKDTFDFEKLHPLTKLLLEKRGIVEKEEVEGFLFPSYEKHIADPFTIYGMEKAVTRIIDAMRNEEKICVYSDYDCDGIPGGVLLRTFFDDIGYPVEMYVPHRHNEGYGVHKHAIDDLKEKGVKLIITVDSGITNIEEVDYAKSVGVDFIITDHHLPITEEVKKGKKVEMVQKVPDAVAVINSKQDSCDYWDDMLCGCAVAWKLSCAVLARLKEEKEGNGKLGGVVTTVKGLKDGYEKWLLDLVGISTISDMVPLQKENRALAHFGLKVLRLTKRHGLNQIFRAQGVSKEYLTEEDIAFTIAPRINAAGRMGDPIQAHNMLYEKDSVMAQGYVEDLEALNMERKESVKDITGAISFDHAVYGNDVIAVGDLSWGPGILGLIAQKIIDETGKPTFVWGRGGAEISEPVEENRSRSEERRRVPELASEGTQGAVEGKITKGEIKGSCRSKGDVHVVELMARVQEMFPGVITHSGGHEQAGGFSCALERVGELSDALNEALKHVTIKEIGDEKLVPDTQLSLEDVNLITHNAVNILAPFGVGNAKPLFSFTNVTPQTVRWFGKKGEHLEVIYPRSKGEVKAIIFFASKDLEERAKKPHTLLAHLEKSVFRGKTELRLRIREIV